MVNADGLVRRHSRGVSALADAVRAKKFGAGCHIGALVGPLSVVRAEKGGGGVLVPESSGSVAWRECRGFVGEGADMGRGLPLSSSDGTCVQGCAYGARGRKFRLVTATSLCPRTWAFHGAVRVTRAGCGAPLVRNQPENSGRRPMCGATSRRFRRRRVTPSPDPAPLSDKGRDARGHVTGSAVCPNRALSRHVRCPVGRPVESRWGGGCEMAAEGSTETPVSVTGLSPHPCAYERGATGLAAGEGSWCAVRWMGCAGGSFRRRAGSPRRVSRGAGSRIAAVRFRVHGGAHGREGHLPLPLPGLPLLNRHALGRFLVSGVVSTPGLDGAQIEHSM
ncbi:hypothetical protein SAMN05216268_105282 [Streptomyces yunnanensis]|uniref:Uncharacterized protein n=1 Tax=Streptomyces yunnanensis TaxID=156453 RepID=A0A9X8MSF6_9ACTN|nr:hypothetical protein SAMN05216268_105282 [Streptomyces yunnanensis]